jgi:hypothetical protein
MRYKCYTLGYVVILILYLVRPGLPYILYEFNKEYISKNLCVEKDNPGNSCNGKCHLKEQINKNGENNDAENPDKRKINLNSKVEDHLLSRGVLSTAFKKDLSVISIYSIGSIQKYLKVIFIPPEIC